MKQFFLGLTFKVDDIMAMKVDSFKRRFDSKYLTEFGPTLSLLPPFICPFGQMNELLEDIEDQIENMMFELNEIPTIEFKQMDVITGKRNFVVARTNWPIDIEFCRESLQDILSEHCKAYELTFGKKKNQDSFLILARNQDQDVLHFTIEAASKELIFPLILRPQKICLFERIDGRWTPRHTLYERKNYTPEMAMRLAR